MNPQAYELWHEHFSGMIRLNDRWDFYDRLALELFRIKKKPPLTVVEFGFTYPKSDWSKDRMFTQQMQWMAEEEYAKCLVITKDERAVEKCEDHYKKLKIFVPSSELPLTNYFKSVIHGIELKKCDLVVLGEPMSGVLDFDELPSGCLIVPEPAMELVDVPKSKKIYSGSIPIWRKI